ncbi:C25 family cysteine peptidase [Salinibacter altiplanensis]|uniref:C25 family cysteine peptidase n=1 Tax=Salinibacter altiplanensis TaxID=1803181 RepID=UPI00131A3B27|nr:C25 family cysteine peptidase [Salinibacter altiplanensis]
MHVLVVPSWYPTTEVPLNGIYFAEQARCLQADGMTVGVVYPEQQSLRRATVGALRRKHFQTAWTTDHGVPTLRRYGWNVWWRVPPGLRCRVRNAVRLARRYVDRRGVPDVIHAQSARWAGAAAARMSNALGVPYVLTEHFSGFQRGGVWPWRRPLVDRGLRRASGLAAVSVALKEALATRKGIASGDVAIHPNPVRASFFTRPPDGRPSRPPFRFVTIARLNSRKNIGGLIAALAQAFEGSNDVVLTVVGDGPQRAALEAQARRLNVADRVDFRGRQRRAGVRAALRGLLLLMPVSAVGQAGDDFDSGWYDPEAPHLQISVATDGVYRVSAGALAGALPDGTTLADISPETIRLLENGMEVPVHVEGAADGALDPSDTVTFVGHRNRGDDERWAYDGDASAQSSAHRSLYSDTTHYWMTWGGNGGRRYAQVSPSASPPTKALRDTVRIEQDETYYFGRPSSTGNPLYTESEGYYWRQFRHNDTAPLSETYTLPVGRRADTVASLDLRVRVDAASSSCHRVEIEGKLRQPGGTPAFESLATAEWEGLARRTLEASVVQNRIPEGGLEVRVTSYNDGFSADLKCSDPSSTPNYVLFDWAEAAYTRTLAAQAEDVQRFAVPTTDAATVALTDHTGDSVRVYSPADARRYEAAIEGDTAFVEAAPSTAPAPHWAVGADGYKTPAAVQPDASSNWSDPDAHSADYLLLTTEALLPAAEQLADYRRSHDGYDVEVGLVGNIFDEFDYGRRTPVAIRRFVQSTRDWASAPEYLAIFADAQYPIRDGSVDTLYPEWSVPSFGYAPSDGWFAMQSEGPDDWSELLAVGRIPVRSVAQGELFVDKLQTYEAAPLERWQKRMLLLAGGTTESEQNQLQFYSNRWGEIASDMEASIDGSEVPVPTGADTLRYYKRVNDPLDASFQDSLAVDLQRGTGWLSYFGHSGAQTWEIVTDPPAEFDNAGRLPVVVSLGCRTGSFAGGRFEEKSAPSLGEQIVVGSVRPDGTPRDGALNGGIAHFGESALGNLVPSARLNDALVQRVFVDTMRVLGEAIRSAKAEIAADFGNSDFYVKHLLQYGLIGDPATNVALPAKPDLHVSSDLIATEPTAPVPSDALTTTVQVQNRGLVPSDSVTARLTWARSDGRTTQRTRRLDRFALKRTLSFSDSLDEQAIGTNTFRVAADPTNRYEEVNETNNTAERGQVVFDAGVSLLAPPDYGTIPAAEPSLEVVVSRQAAGPIPVVLQLDTVPDFSSPARREVRREVDGLRGAWQPPGLSSDQTYYWRARLADAEAGTWRTARFTVDGEEGDGEASWLQRGRLFAENESPRLRRAGRSWTFDTYSRNVLAFSERGQGARTDGFIIDGTSDYEYLKFGFGVLVMNGLTGDVRASESFPTYDLPTQWEDYLRDRGEFIGDGQDAIDALDTFLDTVPQQGDYVFVRTRHLARQGGATIPDEVTSLFQTLGSAAVDTLTYNHVWALKARIGHPDETVEQVSPPSEAEDVKEVSLVSEPPFSHAAGRTISSRIGPASDWGTLNWEGTAPDASDAVTLDVLAADSTVLIDDLDGPSGTQALGSIDAETHPYLHLRATLTDSTARTAPQLDRWSVSHTGVPELVLDPSGLASLPDTLRQGEQASAPAAVVNLGPVASRPVRVRSTLQDASNTTTTLLADTLAALSPDGGRDTSALSVSSTDFPNGNVLRVEARTEGPPERLPSNNTAVRNLFVQADDQPPSLRVLANGRELPPTSDDVTNLQAPELPFVSTQPTLEVLVQDDNPYLLLDDTTHVDVYLKGGLPSRGPGLETDFRRVPFSDPGLSLVPPDSGTTDPLRLQFEPDLGTRDSTYTLKVEAEDTRGNAVEPYQGSFRVQRAQVIRDVYPYPNPMNTHTTFAFRVEGGRNEALRDFTLRIYTLSGRLVRQLEDRHLDQPLRVGWNTLRWNGRDEDGDRVATGVYLYRVKIEGTDTTFRGDVEKISVIR